MSKFDQCVNIILAVLLGAALAVGAIGYFLYAATESVIRDYRDPPIESQPDMP